MTSDSLLSRRALIAGGASLCGLALAGCKTTLPQDKPEFAGAQLDQSVALMYRAMPEEQFPVPAVDTRKIKPQFFRRVVEDPTGERPGTVYVDTRNYYLYLVEPGGMARRYGVGLGKAGFEWSGRARIAWKRKWPKWTPPDEMIARDPKLEKYSVRNGGMAPGLDNPLGARALYIFEGGEDTLYRVHGTNETWSIGKAVSSGCVRLLHHDVIDLYDRVPNDTSIVVA